VSACGAAAAFLAIETAGIVFAIEKRRRAVEEDRKFPQPDSFHIR